MVTGWGWDCGGHLGHVPPKGKTLGDNLLSPLKAKVSTVDLFAPPSKVGFHQSSKEPFGYYSGSGKTGTLTKVPKSVLRPIKSMSVQTLRLSDS